LRDATGREIDQVAAEFHSQLPRNKANGTGAMYARYSSRFQHSIADQVRTLYEAAVKQGDFVPRDHVFFDLAVRGYKEQRPGLDQLRAVLNPRRIDVLLVFTTNRLFRKTYKALQFVEEEVVEHGIRCLFVKSGVDTADEKRWRMLLQVHAMTDEFVVGMYADNIRAAHEGLFDHQMVCGTITFGYRGEPIAGEFTKRRRPRCRVALDPQTAATVLKTYQSYVGERLSIAEIARRLNADPDIPLGPKCASGRWTRTAVRRLLGNPRYRGWWGYGVTQNVWQSKQDYGRQVPRAEPLREGQFDELRIVPDDLWHAAQQRLAEEGRRNGGRKPKDGNRGARPRLLNGIFRCPTHDQSLYVGGAHGHYMSCRHCLTMGSAERPLFSQLPRELAMRLTCEKLADLIRRDEGLVALVVAACRHEAARLRQPDPSEQFELQRRIKQLSSQIQFLLKNAGETDQDRREATENLKELRRTRAEIAAEISRREAGKLLAAAVPDAEAVRGLLRELAVILQAAAAGESDAAAGAVRELIESLTGGRIELFQKGERQARRGWLQGRFRVRLLRFAVEKMVGGQTGVDDRGVEVVIDYKEPSPFEAEAERAKALYDQGLRNSQIAATLGRGRNWVTKLLKRWFEAHGSTMPDGRRRRSTLTTERTAAPLYQQIAEQAKGLWDAGLADLQIAERLGCSPPTVVAAVAFWYQSRGLAAPSHGDRRAALVDRMLVLYDAGRMVKEIAAEVGMCSRSVTVLLRERFAALGRPMPDGRTRHGGVQDLRKPECGHDQGPED
jgi:hypothetical protein